MMQHQHLPINDTKGPSQNRFNSKTCQTTSTRSHLQACCDCPGSMMIAVLGPLLLQATTARCQLLLLLLLTYATVPLKL
jgi:hypothetical protein